MNVLVDPPEEDEGQPAQEAAQAPFDPGEIVDGGEITSPYGPRWGRFHYGVDIDTPAGGDNIDVHCPVDGTVEFVGGDYGTVNVRDEHGYLHQFLHLDSWPVAVGDEVSRGDAVGIMGGRGPEGPNQYDDHVHYQVRNPEGERVNPETDYPHYGGGGNQEEPPGPGDPPAGDGGPGSYGAGDGGEGPGEPGEPEPGEPEPGEPGDPGDPEGPEPGDWPGWPGDGFRLTEPDFRDNYDVHTSDDTWKNRFEMQRQLAPVGEPVSQPAPIAPGARGIDRALAPQAHRLERLEGEARALASAGSEPWAASRRTELLIGATRLSRHMDHIALSSGEAAGLGLALLKKSLAPGRKGAVSSVGATMRLAAYVSLARAYELSARTLSGRAGRLVETLGGGGRRG